MTTLGKLFVVSQFILSLTFAIIAGMFFAHRMPWNTPAPSAGGTPVPGLVDQHKKKIEQLVEPHDRANMRWLIYNDALSRLEVESVERQKLFKEKLDLLRTGNNAAGAAQPQAVTVIEYDPKNSDWLPTGRVKVTGAKPIQYREKDLLALDLVTKEFRRLHLDSSPLGPTIPETQKKIETLLVTYNGLTILINGEGATRGLRREIALQEEARKNAVAEREYLKPFLANAYSETLLLLQRQNSLRTRQEELKNTGVASGTKP